MQRNLYRLVGLDGEPHPVLDTPFESVEAAIGAAKNWESGRNFQTVSVESTIGVEVKTINGSWRTIRYPRNCLHSDIPSSIT